MLSPALAHGAPAAAVANEAASQTIADALVVEPGQTCLDAQTLLSDLRSWREDDQLDSRVEILVQGASDRGDALRFELRVAGEVMVERPFDPAPEDCADLHAVLALAIAIALDETLAGKLGVVEPAPGPVAQVEAGEGGVPALERRAPRPERPGPALSLTALGLISAGLTPGLTGGGALSFDIRPRDHFDLRIGAFAIHESAIPISVGEVDLTVSGGRLDLCWGTRPLAVRLRLCGGAAGGAVHARARGFKDSGSETTPWFAGLVDVDVSVAVIGPLALELRIEGVVPFQRTRIEIASETGGPPLGSERLSAAALLVSLGPRFEF